MGKAKEIAMQVVASLPDDCTWDDVEYRVCLRAKIERGLAAAPGDLIPHDRMMLEMKEWLASLGRQTPDSTSNGS